MSTKQKFYSLRNIVSLFLEKKPPNFLGGIHNTKDSYKFYLLTNSNNYKNLSIICIVNQKTNDITIRNGVVIRCAL